MSSGLSSSLQNEVILNGEVYKHLYILKTSSNSALFLLSSRVNNQYIPVFFSYGSSFNLGTILVDLSCMRSNNLLSDRPIYVYWYDWMLRCTEVKTWLQDPLLVQLHGCTTMAWIKYSQPNQSACKCLSCQPEVLLWAPAGMSKTGICRTL